MKKEKLFGVALLVFAVVKLTERPRIVPPATPAGNLQNNYAAWIAYAQNVYKQAVALYGSIQNAITVLWGPGGPFEKTPIPEYDAGTLFWGEVEGGGVAGIGRVFKTIPPGKTELQRLLTARSQVIEYSKNEATLFGRRRRGAVHGISPSWAFLLPGV